MPRLIEDYGMIGDGQTAALVDRKGSIDWLCWPRFDSDACFASLLGTSANGRWKVAPSTSYRCTCRRYQADTLILETELDTSSGCIRLVDFMPVHDGACAVIRVVQGLRGKVQVRSELDLRFDYGSLRPALEVEDARAVAFVGPDLVVLHSPTPLRRENSSVVTELEVNEGQQVDFCLRYGPSRTDPPPPLGAKSSLSSTQQYWRSWIQQFRVQTKWPDAVRRSLLTLKAMIFRRSGGIIAAPTTSLPETLAGDMNWDYRYCWLRDATFTLSALLDAGYHEEAKSFRDWLLRAVGGEPDKMRIMYRVDGSRRLEEWVASWLPGCNWAEPVRIGNAAASQFQLDVYGELVDSVSAAAKAGISPSEREVALITSVVEHVERVWELPDHGLWELRGRPRHYTYSKVSAWAAVDRFVRRPDLHSLFDAGQLDRMRALRDRMHRDICDRAFDPSLGTFVAFYGSEKVDASLLNLPLVGFLPVTDERVRETIATIERELVQDGYVHRWGPKDEVREAAFLACSGWLADCQLMQGRRAEAERTFQRLLDAANDLGLLSEEYDVHAGRLAGNFPQGLSHLALVRTALRFDEQASDRGEGHDIAATAHQGAAG
ncbi:glycoside hydrolase family 15 protein [Bradyrhizobium sp. STM 3561]|uniref:glycoside hydrolase family 15 protein n=1 Tax=Bradyrhizobium sp. STM 3561 TaxID=578923 RepID=UPI00388EAB39